MTISILFNHQLNPAVRSSNSFNYQRVMTRRQHSICHNSCHIYADTLYALSYHCWHAICTFISLLTRYMHFHIPVDTLYALSYHCLYALSYHCWHSLCTVISLLSRYMHCHINADTLYTLSYHCWHAICNVISLLTLYMHCHITVDTLYAMSYHCWHAICTFISMLTLILVILNRILEVPTNEAAYTFVVTKTLLFIGN